MTDSEVKTFDLGDFPLSSGRVIPKAFIAYKTFGSPSSPAIIYPTWYSGLISDNECTSVSSVSLKSGTSRSLRAVMTHLGRYE